MQAPVTGACFTFAVGVVIVTVCGEKVVEQY